MSEKPEENGTHEESEKKIKDLTTALKRIEDWESQGDKIKDAYDYVYGHGSWNKLVG